jgi:hypothetical protein
MKESTIDLEDNQNTQSIPYLVNRKVLKQNEVEATTKYERHIDTRKLIM